MDAILDRAARHEGRGLPRRRDPPGPFGGVIGALGAREGDGPGGGITCHVVEPAKEALHAPWPEAIPEAVRRAFARLGIALPWTHQAETMRHVAARRDVVVVTPTASGKSLCYVAPILARCLRSEDVRALLLFPTKALALDQLQRLQEAVDALRAEAPGFELPVFTYDGDTPADARRAVRRRGRIVVTNPDMLHSTILPQHARWSSLFEGLDVVVVDELHSYRGVFGSHVANVLRRLRRTAAFHGSRPVFVACSATIANPGGHAERLLGGECRVVDDDGAPRGERHVVFYNPPVVNAALGIRAGALQATSRLAARSIELGFQTIAFARSRLSVEILTRYVKDALARRGGRGEDRRRSPSLVEGYRGGYLPGARRRIQEALRAGTLRGVVATNALELGLDVGSLDVAVLCGYPGSIASTRQQMGRAGRRGTPSACILVARSGALDQHVIQRPEFVMGATPEQARIDPDNLLVLAAHVKCAAFELPFRDGESFGALGPSHLAELLALLQEEGILHREGDTWHWTQETQPAQSVSLRTVTSDNFVVVDVGDPARHQVIAEVDFTSAPTTIHEKAIYMVGARQYQVDRLDHEGRKAYVTPVDCDYYTDAICQRRVAVLERFEAAALDADVPATGSGATGAARAWSCHGEVRVSRKVVGFKKVRFYTSENLGYGDVELPEQEMHTTSAWLTIAAPGVEWLARRGLSRRQVVEALSGAAHALHAVASILLCCDGRDLETALGDARGTGAPGWHLAQAGSSASRLEDGSGDPFDPDADERFEPTLFLHDSVPGGVGFSPLLHERRRWLVEEALDLVRGCACEDGCPACVGATLDSGSVRQHARTVLEMLAGAP